jgi:diguanylate cyclase (GGDEF)-like protein
MTHDTLDSDPLTGLALRPAFLADLDAAVEAAKRSGTHVCIALCDLDLFAALNEACGTETGDEVLKAVAAVLAESFADQQARIYRYGGDAFTLLWPDQEKEQVFLAMERARVAVEQPNVFRRDGKPLHSPLTVSVGIAVFPEDADNPTELVNKVNEAMYRAKTTGPNKVCLAREERMTTKTSHYTQGQLQGLQRLAKRKGIGEALLLREALNDLLRKHNA